MPHLGSRRGEANLGLPLMLLTFIVIGGFMYYLYATAEPTQPAVMEEVDETPSDAGDSGAAVVEPDALKTGADAYVGQVVRLESVPVSSTMGSQVFFVDLPESDNLPSTPFLVRMSQELVDAGTAVTMIDDATLTGTVVAMNDSIVNDWIGAGIISEGDRLLVEFATHFLNAESVEITGGAEAPAGS